MKRSRDDIWLLAISAVALVFLWLGIAIGMGAR